MAKAFLKLVLGMSLTYQPLQLGNPSLVFAPILLPLNALSGFSASSSHHRDRRLGWMPCSQAI
jgi:hypothetical protein